MVDEKPKQSLASRELKSLEIIARELLKLTPAEQQRVLWWAADRFLSARLVSKGAV